MPSTGDLAGAITGNRPVIGGFVPATGMGHMVVIRSFHVGTFGWQFGYMDPNTTTKQKKLDKMKKI